jgi:hypothetical protein
LTIAYWLVVGLAVTGILAALFGGRPAITLPGSATAAGAFALALAIASAEGDYLAALVHTAASISAAMLLGSCLRHGRPRPVETHGYPLLRRIRGDLTGATRTIEALDAEAVRQRGRGEQPGSLALVERMNGRFVRIHAAAPVTHAAALADEAFRLGGIDGIEFVPAPADSGAIVLSDKAPF